jgi:hypothetical protein
MPARPLAELGSPALRDTQARDALHARGIRLHGHQSAIDELLNYECLSIAGELREVDQQLGVTLAAAGPGRPQKHSVLRDILVYGLVQIVAAGHSIRSGIDEAQAIGRVRKNAASAFGLSDRKNSPATEQVRRAMERTEHRLRLLALIRGGHNLVGPLFDLAVTVVALAAAGQDDTPAFRRDAEILVSTCRTLDAIEKACRQSGSKARAAATAARRAHVPKCQAISKYTLSRCGHPAHDGRLCEIHYRLEMKKLSTQKL